METQPPAVLHSPIQPLAIGISLFCRIYRAVCDIVIIIEIVNICAYSLIALFYLNTLRKQLKSYKTVSNSTKLIS